MALATPWVDGTTNKLLHKHEAGEHMSFDNVEPVSRSTASARVIDTLRAAILDGSMVPGSQLKETALADRLSVSRGPLREAVQRLVQEGLLWSQPHHGTFVVELGRDDVADIYLARRGIERTAAMAIQPSCAW
jgi:DNA-binding GntR family transcriptional regulator